MMYTKSKIILFVFSLFLLVFLCACKNSGQPQPEETSKYPVQIGNLTFYSEPDTVIPLTDQIAQVLIGLEAQDKIIGIPSDCTCDALSDLPYVGTSDSPDLESILSLNPELLITNVSLSSNQMGRLSEQRIKVLVLSGNESRYDSILSKLFKHSD